MKLTEITAANLESFESYLGKDTAENIGRECFNGLVLTDEEEKASRAAVVWKSTEDEEKKKRYAELSCFSAAGVEEGTQVIGAFADRIDEEGTDASFFEFADLKEELRTVFTGAGYSLREGESRDLKLSVGELKELPFAKKKLPYYVTCLDGLSEGRFWQGISNALYNSRQGLLEDLDSLPLSFYEQEISCVAEEDGKIRGMFLIHRRPSGILMPVLLYAGGPDSRKNLLYMLSFSVQAALCWYSEDTEVLLRRHDEKTRSLTDYLFPGRQGSMAVIGERRREYV